MVDPFIIGAGISAASNLAGGLLGLSGAREANSLARGQAQANRKLQEQFAQSGIQWRVADAKAAGIHPLYALGANTPTYTPVSANFTAPDYSFVGRMGQDLGRGLQRSALNKQRQDTAKIEQSRLSCRDSLAATESAARTQLYQAQTKLALSKIRPQAGIGGATGTGAGTGQDDAIRNSPLHNKGSGKTTGFLRAIPKTYMWGKLPGPPIEDRHMPVANPVFKETAEDFGLTAVEAWAYLKSLPAHMIQPYKPKKGFEWVWNNSRTYIYQRHNKGRRFIQAKPTPGNVWKGVMGKYR